MKVKSANQSYLERIAMLTIAIAVAVGFVIGVIAYFAGGGFASDFFGTFLVVIVIGVGIAAITSVLGGSDPNTEKYHSHELALSSLNDDASRTHGTFFLGTGHIDTDFCYFYYYKESDGAYIPARLCSSEGPIKVYQEDRLNAVLITKHEHGRSKRTKWNLFTLARDETLGYEFHVPRGSIREEYQLG